MYQPNRPKPDAIAREVVMKVQRQLFAIALLLTTSVSGLAGLSAEEKREHLRMLRATERLGPVNVTSLDRAYLDALSILDQQGPCADFFGGQDRKSTRLNSSH